MRVAMNHKTQQLLPGFTVRNDADFDSFYAPGSLRLIKSTLMQCVSREESDCIYLSGSGGSGKSHLLQAVCNAAASNGKQAIYLPMQELKAYPPEAVLEGMVDADFICLDDIDAISGLPGWQEAVFHLYNQRFALEKPVYFAAGQSARALDFQLPDLVSRLAACLAFQLPALNDEEKTALLQHLADLRGMRINDASAAYIIQRSGRSIHDLVSLLELLDRESLIANRRITVPFIKSLTGW